MYAPRHDTTSSVLLHIVLCDGNSESICLVDLTLGSYVSCRKVIEVGRWWRVVTWWRSWRLLLIWPQFHVKHVIGS